MNSTLRKLGRKIGLDIHRYHPDPNKLHWVKSHDIKTVIDVGANVGQFASEIRNALPHAFIYSFEPLKDCFEKLKLSRGRDQLFKAFNYALGNCIDTIPMNRNAYSPSSSILSMSDSHKQLFPHTSQSARERVDVLRLDDFSELNPQLLSREILFKIDTQGFEAEVIKGARRFLSHVKLLIVENSFIPLYEEQPLFDDIYTLLKSYGFTYRGALQQKINKNTGAIIFEDSFFLKA